MPGLSQRFQITTDGFAPYRAAICDTLGDRVDFAQLIKVYRQPEGDEARYSVTPTRSDKSASSPVGRHGPRGIPALAPGSRRNFQKNKGC